MYANKVHLDLTKLNFSDSLTVSELEVIENVYSAGIEIRSKTINITQLLRTRFYSIGNKYSPLLC